ncbi:MAG: 50S ribosomal protein L9 [Clostridia bacterium]
MKVILMEDIKGLGKQNEMVEAKDGYAKNFLLKRNLAIEATPENLNTMKSRQKAARNRTLTQSAEAMEVKERLEGKTVVIKTKSGENGKLYGSITAKDISDEIKKQHNVEVDKKKIVIQDHHIKTISTNEVPIKIHAGITANITVIVEEAE